MCAAGAAFLAPQFVPVVLAGSPCAGTGSSSCISASSDVLLLMVYNLFLPEELRKCIRPTVLEDFSN